ncbi:hypothetical protein F5Y10DRAFT_294207 [Nemania abortiva]|nr:hypothetical protein F5Y10DRAFT_294207 [Nemania abortiva]
MTNYQQGLEVVFHDAPEVDRGKQADLIVCPEWHEPSSGAEDASIAIGESCSRPQKEKSRVLSRRRLWVVVTFGILVIIIAVIGGLLGGLLLKRGSTDGEKATVSSTPIELSGTTTFSSTTTPVSPSPTSSTPSLISTTSSASTTILATAFPTSGTLSLDCPAINATEESRNVSNGKYIFEIYCGFDGYGSQGDSIPSNTYTINDCINQCAGLNSIDGAQGCGGVVWNGNLTSAFVQGGNCYFKRGTMDLANCNQQPCLLAAAAKLVNSEIALSPIV